MKKTKNYIQPNFEIVEIYSEGILCDSGGSNPKPNPNPGNEGVEDKNEIW